MRITISQKVNIINRRFCAAIMVVILSLPFAVPAEDAELPPASNGSTGDRQGEPPQSSPEIDAIRATAHDFTEAFNRGDARAMAAYWTPEGEFIGPDGSTLVGRESIEQTYAEFFREHPHAKLTAAIESVRLLGPNVAIETGTTALQLANRENEASAGRYSVLHVRGDDGWRMASVREWADDLNSSVTLKDVAWLVGEWEVANDELSARVTYTMNEGDAFLRGRYERRQGDDVLSSGTEMIGRNPDGGLRSWRFDASGAVSESVWMRDDQTWVVETAGTLSDGSEVSASTLLTPIDENSFLWQATARSVGGEPLPGTRPLKIRRAGTAAPSAKEPTLPGER